METAGNVRLTEEMVLHRDSNLLIIDKPAGLAVHPGPRTPVSVEGMAAGLRFGLRHDPMPAHRLDRDTSGCLVLARHQRILRRLGQLFTEHAVHKTYWALVVGQPAVPDGTVTLPLAKRNNPKGWRMVVDPMGLRAETRYRVLAAAQGLSLLELRPQTGRTHQIRVHCAALGCPVLGDPVYGRALADLPHHLHARALAFRLGPDGAEIAVTAPLPALFQQAMDQAGFAALPAAALTP